MTAHLIVDLGFGDAGKGLLTDYLARQIETNLVVRYNGGAQAGHNVVTPQGLHHTFSQFGAASFLPQMRTFLSKYVVVHPAALLIEGDLLAQKGVFEPFSRLRISENALIITPFQQAANRIRELARGADRHGSCGVGVGETVADAEKSVRAGDLAKTDILREKLKALQEKKGAEVNAICKANAHNPAFINECALFEVSDIIDLWIEAVERVNKLGLVVADDLLGEWLRQTPNVIFEGAQGVLLDEDFGFFPHVTRSRTTTQNAAEILAEFAPKMPTQRIGVLRSYAVRHGAGPLPSEDLSLNEILAEHNMHNLWQGSPRYGCFDAMLARYALAATGGVDVLAITHMDVLLKLKEWRYVASYQDWGGIDIPADVSLDERAQFAKKLSQVAPILASCAANDNIVIKKIEELLGQKVGILSYGQSTGDVQAPDSTWL